MALNVVSFGGGVNSTALLIGLHERNETPDLILFADTGGELPKTYNHILRMQAWCNSVGFPPITVVSYDTSAHGTLEQECLNNETLPSKAFGFSGCSVKWKRQPMDKFIENWKPAIETWGQGGKVGRLIGIHAGEKGRGKIPDTDKFKHVYPLRDWGWWQEDCIAAINRAGLPVPIKSACFFCPSMKKREILALKREHPDLFGRAVAIEQNAIEAGNLETVKGLGRNWRWEALANADENQLRLFWDHQPPICESCFDGD
jgi:hypothetical protein